MHSHIARAMKDPELLLACKTVLSIYVTTVVMPQWVFVNPSSNSWNWTNVYEKRQEFARMVMQDPEPYIEAMAWQVALIDPDYDRNALSNWQPLYNYLLWNWNPIWISILEVQPMHASRNTPWNQSWLTLFDMLAWIDDSDRIA
jgi:hypothetical protein